MGCLLVLIGAAAPRFGLFIFWLLRPDRLDAAFDTFILPFLGIIFFPYATLLYAILWTPGGLTSWEWFWVALMGLFDLMQPSIAAARRQDLYPSRYGPPGSSSMAP